jgi:hypothetical protein
MNLENTINNEIKINNNNFLNNALGKTINGAVDIGLRAILPDLIENQVIDIKNALLQNGLKEGIKTAVDSAINFGKSIYGIVSGNFENMSQIRLATEKGGIIDSLSRVIDKACNKAYINGHINGTTNSLIKKGKDVILNNISNNIKKEIDSQTFEVEKLENYVSKWKEGFNNKDFDVMQKYYKKIDSQLSKTVPLEKIIKEARELESIHKLIENNGHNFNITELEKETAKNINNI